MNDLEIYKCQDMIRQIASLNQKCEDNMKRLNAMMLELKGIVAMVRPQVKKTGWYGDELTVEKVMDTKEIGCDIPESKLEKENTWPINIDIPIQVLNH